MAINCGGFVAHGRCRFLFD